MELKIDLLHDSGSALTQLDNYIKGIDQKANLFVEKMGAEGVTILRAEMSAVPQGFHEKAGNWNVPDAVVSTEVGRYATTITVSGDKVMFVEFSAGITYGDAPGSYPLEAGKEYGYGTYPGKGQGLKPMWRYYNKSISKTVVTHGTPSYKPVYHTIEQLRQRMTAVAREVFTAPFSTDGVRKSRRS